MSKFRSRYFAYLLTLFLICDSMAVVGEGNHAKWRLVFHDEFNSSKSQPSARYWKSCPREPYLWCRWIKTDSKTIFVKNGKLICRAIPNQTARLDTARMLTGAICSKDLYSFQYGKVEVRLKTNATEGNFPAVWLMPQDLGNPYRYGEIDIFEAFGKDGLAHQTVHSHLSFILNDNSGMRSFGTKTDLTQWHIYSVEWDSKLITFKIDGKTIGSYEKSNDPNRLAKGQWTFDRPFYIILNQSVGNDTWHTPDYHHTYETQIDWVRVYQR